MRLIIELLCVGEVVHHRLVVVHIETVEQLVFIEGRVAHGETRRHVLGAETILIEVAVGHCQLGGIYAATVLVVILIEVLLIVSVILCLYISVWVIPEFFRLALDEGHVAPLMRHRDGCRDRLRPAKLLPGDHLSRKIDSKQVIALSDR